MNRHVWTMTVALAALPAMASADPWKDESGKGRRWAENRGETPAWARGRGYWDGHFQQGRSMYEPGIYQPAPGILPLDPYHMPPPVYGGDRWNRGHGDYRSGFFDDRGASKHWHKQSKKIRERDRKAYKKQVEHQRKRAKKFREAERKAQKEWSKRLRW